jgi:hypothetical protein
MACLRSLRLPLAYVAPFGHAVNRTAGGAVGGNVDKPTVEIRCTWAEFGKLNANTLFWGNKPEQIRRVLGTPRAQRALAALEAGENRHACAEHWGGADRMKWLPWRRVG